MDDGNDILALGVDADDYATAAAEDQATSTDRTHLSDEAFADIKAGYTAKYDNGDIYKSLPRHLPPPAHADDTSKPKLTNKHIVIVSAAAGELYFYRRLDELLITIGWLRSGYDLDSIKPGKGKEGLGEMLDRWERMCRAQMKPSEGELSETVSGT